MKVKNGSLYFLSASGPFAGMESTDVIFVSDHTLSKPERELESFLDDEAWDFARDNAETYGYYVRSDDDETEADWLIEGDEIGGTHEPYNPEKHDMHKSGGGSFLKDWREVLLTD